jgi:hypothetical protein
MAPLSISRYFGGTAQVEAVGGRAADAAFAREGK